jgi:hypothetical protein
VARKAEWIVRLPGGIDALKRLSCVVVDAKTLAGILKLNLRVAQKLLARFASAEYGGMAERRALIAGLEAIARGEAEVVEAEVQRRAKLRETLNDAVSDLFLHAVKLPPETDARKLRRTKMADLPPTLTVTRGCIHISDSTGLGALAQIRQLCYAVANDEDRFVEAIEGEVPAAKPQGAALGI